MVEPAPLSFSVSTRRCARFRFVGRWRLVATSGPVHSYPEIEATIPASANRLSSVRWSDRGSGLGSDLTEPTAGSVVRVGSPWFTRVTPDPVALTVTTHPVLDRGADAFAERWRRAHEHCSGRYGAKRPGQRGLQHAGVATSQIEEQKIGRCIIEQA